MTVLRLLLICLSKEMLKRRKEGRKIPIGNMHTYYVKYVSV